MKQSLTDLANRYGTDKGTIGPSATWGAHNYTDVYEAYLEGYRQLPLVILEIGLGVTGDRWKTRIVQGRNAEGGASLRMWYDYFPDAQIYGFDVNDGAYLDNERITTFVADQGKVEDLDSFMTAIGDVEFDVIIDDGSHRPEHQQVSLSYFFRRLKVGGLYFIEDLLSNGLGDGAVGGTASASVKNTRSVLKHFLVQGEFLQPNALFDQAYLAEHIEYMRFHVPYARVKYAVQTDLRRPIKRVVYFTPDTESLCVIRKG
jgi:hypothetical protein